MFLAGGEEQLDPHRRPLRDESPGGGEDGRDRRLVVGAEDRVVAVAEHAVLRVDLDRSASGTVSRWAHSSTVRASAGPSMRASRLPQSEPVSTPLSSSSTSRPSPSSSALTAAATARSLRDGLSISQSRTKSSSSRSRSAVEALCSERTVTWRRLPGSVAAVSKAAATPPELELSWPAALAWRMRRHHLIDRSGPGSLPDVVDRICGLHAQVMSSAELTAWARVEGLDRAAVSDALWQERAVVKLWAMRGTLHLLTARELPTWLGALGTYDHFLKPAWLRAFESSREELEALVVAVGRGARRRAAHP